MPQRLKAPWPDYSGNPIHEGDKIRHPTGDEATVFFDMKHMHTGQWRAVYEDGVSLWLGNQIGSKGQAVVIKG